MVPTTHSSSRWQVEGDKPTGQPMREIPLVQSFIRVSDVVGRRQGFQNLRELPSRRIACVRCVERLHKPHIGSQQLQVESCKSLHRRETSNGGFVCIWFLGDEDTSLAPKPRTHAIHHPLHPLHPIHAPKTRQRSLAASNLNFALNCRLKKGVRGTKKEERRRRNESA